MFGLEKPSQREVQPEGSPDSKIALIGEAPGGHEQRAGRPFIGPAGSVLDNCIHSAGLVRSDLYITNFLKTQPFKNNISPWFDSRKGLTKKGEEAAERLAEELSNVKANVLVPLGAAAMCALTGMKAILSHRGYVVESSRLPGRKVLPTIHPAAALRGQYVYRYYIVADLKKALCESDYPDIRYPERRLIYDPKITHAEACEWLDFIAAAPEIAFDIEVIEFQVSCISFATSPELSVSIPLYGRWTESEEAILWLKIAQILENPATTKITQNGLAFDLWFLAAHCGILVQGPQKDTMVAHSIMYPEMLKGLAFLGSIYTFERYWKADVKWSDPKKES